MEQPAYPPPAWGWPSGAGRAASSSRRRIRRTALIAAIGTGLCFGLIVGAAYLGVAVPGGEAAWLIPLPGSCRSLASPPARSPSAARSV